MSGNVFISWSGKASRAVAEALRDWLPSVIQAVDPWLSSEDIEKGARWSSEISGRLKETRIGIICLAPGNLEAPWVLFEAGALSKTVEDAFVCPYLFHVDQAEVKGPLAQFQLTKAEKEDTRKLLTTINRALGDSALKDEQLKKVFEKWWPDLEKQLRAIGEAGPEGAAVPERSDRDILEEILSIARSQTRWLKEQLERAQLDAVIDSMTGGQDRTKGRAGLADVFTFLGERPFREAAARSLTRKFIDQEPRKEQQEGRGAEPEAAGAEDKE